MNRKRKVQIIFYNEPNGYPPIINGARLLASAGWEVELICRGDGTRWNVDYPEGVRVVRICEADGNSWVEYSAFVARVLRGGSRGAALIYAHDMHALPPARVLATAYRLPLAFHSHDYEDASANISFGGRVMRSFQRRLARASDLVIIPDAERAKIINRDLRLKGDPLIVANAPLERQEMRGPTLGKARSEWRQQFDKVILRQGRIGPGHALEVTLRSMPLWRSRNWGFVVIGVGEKYYIEQLRNQARRLGVERQFVVLPPVGYDKVVDFTVLADLGHALYEPVHINYVHITTASNKIMEYMAAGLPLMTSDRPALRALVEKHKCGLVADETSPESIAAAINDLLVDSNRSNAMGVAARQAFQEVYCYERQFRKVLDAFEQLL